MKIASVLSLMPASLLLVGCGMLERVFGPIDSAPTVYGSQPLTKTDEDLPVDLPLLIAPDLDRSAPVNAGVGAVAAKGTQPEATTRMTQGGLFTSITGIHTHYPQPDLPYEQRLERAYERFAMQTADEQRRRRTEVQEALLGKSTTLCNMYKKRLLQTATEQNLLNGDATTLLAGLATIFSKTATVRPLAGGAAIISGFRSEYNSDVFANLNLQVMTAGIEKRRSDYYSTILKARSCSIADYPLQQAVKDAFIFHQSCSLYAGLEEANASIKQAENPGLNELTDTFGKLAKTLNALQKVVPTAAPTTATAPVTGTFSAASASHSIGQGGCELPIPGAPKLSMQVVNANVVVQTLAGPVTMSYSSDDNPIIATVSATDAVTKSYQSLLQKLNDSKMPDADKAKAKNDLDAAKSAFTNQIGNVQSSGKSAQQAMADYNAALVALQSVTKDSDKQARIVGLEKAHIDNANISAQVNKLLATYNDAAAKIAALPGLSAADS